MTQLYIFYSPITDTRCELCRQLIKQNQIQVDVHRDEGDGLYILSYCEICFYYNAFYIPNPQINGLQWFSEQERQRIIEKLHEYCVYPITIIN